MFGIGPDTLRTPFTNPEHDCYCTKSVADQSGTPSCFLDGVLDVQRCFSKCIFLFGLTIY